MRPAGIYDWFASTQSWPQQSPHPPEKIAHFFPLNRQNSNTESITSRSVGESTRRRSRADAMWRLEGRSRGNSSSTLATSAPDSGCSRFYEDCVERNEPDGHDNNDDDAKEDEDPWKDPWENAIKKNHELKDAGRAYAHTQDVHMVAFEPLSSPYSQSPPRKQEPAVCNRPGLSSSRLDNRRETDIILSLPPTTTRHQAQAHLDQLSNPYELPAPLTSLSPFSTPERLLFLGGGRHPERTYSAFQWNLPHRRTDYTLDRFLSSPISKPLPSSPSTAQNPRISTVSFRKPDFTQNAREVLGWDRRSVNAWPEKVARRHGHGREEAKRGLYTRYELGDVIHDVELGDEVEDGKGRKKRGKDDDMGTLPRDAKFWKNVSALGLIFFNTFGVVFSFGVWMAYYTTEHPQTPENAGRSLPGISLVGSTQLALLFALPLPIARVLDKRQEHHRTVLALGITILFLGLLCTSWCTSLGTIWICQGLLVGLGMGLIFSCTLPAAREIYHQARSKAELLLNLIMATAPLGGIFYILIERALLEAIGFANTMRVLAEIVIALLLPAFFFVSFPRKEPRGISAPPALQRGRLLLTTPQHSETSSCGILQTIDLLLIGLILLFPLFYLPLSTPAILSSNILIYLLLGTLMGHLTLTLLHHSLPRISSSFSILASLVLMSTAIWVWLACEKGEAALVAVALIYGFGSSAGWRWMYGVLLRTQRREGARLEKWFGLQTRSGKEGLNAECWKAGGLAVAMLVGMPICGALVGYGRRKVSGHGFVEVLGFVGGVLGVAIVVMGAGMWLGWHREKKKGTL